MARVTEQAEYSELREQWEAGLSEDVSVCSEWLGLGWGPSLFETHSPFSAHSLGHWVH